MMQKYKWLIIAFTAGLIGCLLIGLFNCTQEISPSVRLLFYMFKMTCVITACVYFFIARKVLIANITLLVTLVLLLEVIFFFVLGMPKGGEIYFGVPNFSKKDIRTQIGIVPDADTTYHQILIKEGDTVYNVQYTFDKNHIRKTPEPAKECHKHALFFGCSIAFGEGVADNQTLPYYFQEFSQQYKAYNYAYKSYGTNHMLARLEYEDLSNHVTEKDGIGVYVFFWDHIYRAICSLQRYSWSYYAPYYKFDKGELVRHKMFQNGRLGVSLIYQLIYQMNMLSYFKVEMPLKLTDYHFDLVSEMVLKSKEKYIEQFGNNDFYLLMYPNYKLYSDEEMERFKYFLDKKNIKVIDLANYIDYDHKYTLGGDPHPNADTHKLIAKALWAKINNCPSKSTINIE